MNNFVSVFEELSKLYEEDIVENVQEELTEEVVEEACAKEELTEAAEDEEIEIVDDEPTDVVPVEEPVEELVVDDEPKQVVIECSKCGALLIKDEADIVAGEEADLVNVEDECQFCEEANGYKIVGTLLPYEAVEDEEPIDEVVEESGEVPAEEENLDEVLDVNIPVDIQANDNEVAVGGATI